MEQNIHPVLIMTTVPDQEIGNKIAHTLIEEHLVACVNIVGQINSVYPWKGEICSDKEYVLFIKTLAIKHKMVFDRIKQLHPYEVPELVMVEINAIGDSYLSWMIEWIMNN